MSYESTLEYIHSVQWRGSKPGLSRTRELLHALDNPEKGLKFVHIAGTNGKGSTAACTASILREAGYKVGLYTSPFINRFNERMQIDGEPISDSELEHWTDVIRPFADRMEDKPTEFELITAVAMLYFARNGCDIVVLEVGMGGELDSTNVIDVPECAVITAMGLDHTRELGPTLADIARAKAGIIKPGGEVVIYGGTPEADAVFESTCRERNASLHTTDFTFLSVHETGLDGCRFDFGGLKDIRLPLLGTYQPNNAAVAITAARVLRSRGWQISDDQIISGLAKVSWPGRFELLCREPVVILDGAHNPHGIHATAESLKAHFPGKKLVFLMGVMADKALGDMLPELVPLAKEFVCVTPHNPRAMDADALADTVRAWGIPAHSCSTIERGALLAMEKAGRNGVVCALGSLYFSADVRAGIRSARENQIFSTEK